MKLPWDEKYLKISFHIILTFAVMYVLALLLNSLAYTFVNLGEVLANITQFFGKIFSLCLPLIVAFVSAYLLDPIVDFFQVVYDRFYESHLRKVFSKYKLFDRYTKTIPVHKKRTAGVFITLMVLVSVLSCLAVFVITKIGDGSGSFAENFAAKVTKTIIDFGDLFTEIQIKLEELGLLAFFSQHLSSFINGATREVSSFALNLTNSVTGKGSAVLNIFLGIVISFYFLRDKAAILFAWNNFMTGLLSPKLYAKVRNIGLDVHSIFSGYIRGQLTDALIMAVLISALLSLIDIQFALLIGIFSGFSNIIPYFGAFIGFGLSVSTAFLSGEPTKALYAGIGILILQQIDGMFIVPKVVGKNVEISPVLVLISLSIAGSLYGIVGMIFAIPVCAILKLFLERSLNRNEP